MRGFTFPDLAPEQFNTPIRSFLITAPCSGGLAGTDRGPVEETHQRPAAAAGRSWGSNLSCQPDSRDRPLESGELQRSTGVQMSVLEQPWA